jgi:hypothetical protein
MGWRTTPGISMSRDLMLDVEGVNYNTCPAYVDSDGRYYQAGIAAPMISGLPL